MVAAATSGLPHLPAFQKMTLARVRAYLPPNPNLLFNQSDMVVTIETDTGIMGVCEGGSKDLLEQAAGRLIGRDPQHIEQLWQDMNRAFFYPAGREKN
jgi:L-alanine-DL-glutamate epimerase-like enolase superfamily enzyme